MDELVTDGFPFQWSVCDDKRHLVITGNGAGEALYGPETLAAEAAKDGIAVDLWNFRGRWINQSFPHPAVPVPES